MGKACHWTMLMFMWQKVNAHSLSGLYKCSQVAQFKAIESNVSSSC